MKGSELRRLGKNAMTVVSMDHHGFGTDYLEQLIWLSGDLHERLYVVLADDLYTYNRSIFVKENKLKQRYTLPVDRRKFIENSVKRSGDAGMHVIFRSWRALCTPRFLDVLRRVYMLVIHEPDLLSSVDDRVKYFADKVRTHQHQLRPDELAAYSRAYIIEETAMALHLASKFEISDEYYPGDDAPVLKNVYSVLDKSGLYRRMALKPHEKRFWNVSLDEQSRISRTLEWANAEGDIPNVTRKTK